MLLSRPAQCSVKRECQPDEIVNSMIKREQLKPRRSKDRVKVSLVILFCLPFSLSVQLSFPSMSVVAVKSTQGHMCYITIFSTAFCYVMPATLLLSFNTKRPWRDLIRVDLIRFPGSIPGAIQMLH